jgi:aminopeptidase YwaD
MKRAGQICLIWGSVLVAAVPLTGQRGGDPVPLLPESVMATMAEEVSGTEAHDVVQELTLHHRMRVSAGIRSAAEVIMRKASAYGLDQVELLELPADGEIFYGTQRSRPAWDVEFGELWVQRNEKGAWVDDRRVASSELRPLSLAQDSATGESCADLVDVGLGMSPEDYAGKPIEGNWVLTASQPGAAARLAVDRYGAAGIVSYAQNQKSAWWGEDRNLVRWGHLGTFPAPQVPGFMVTVNQAMEWQRSLAVGEPVHLRAVVEATRGPGAYTIPMAAIRGSDDALADQEIVFSCHLDHPNPGANDNASGCGAILEVARSLNKMIREGRIPRPRRTIRFFWPPEIEGTIALLNARPEFAANAAAVIHMDMVGGDAERTKAIFHITKSPLSLPTIVNDVAEIFGRFINGQTYEFSATGRADFPLTDPEGSRQALQAQFADFSMGSDHQVWTEGSFGVPAVYLNDWPDRYIHTDGDTLANIDPTKLLRAAFLGVTSGYYLANLESAQVPELLERFRDNSLRRTARSLERARSLAGRDASVLLEQRLRYELRVVESVGDFVPVPDQSQVEAALFLRTLETLVRTEQALIQGAAGPTGGGDQGDRVCHRLPEPKGPMWGFDYSYLEDHLARQSLPTPELLGYRGLWGSGAEYAYEVLNMVDGVRDAGAIRDAVTAIYGPISVDLVWGYIETLAQIGVVGCD